MNKRSQWISPEKAWFTAEHYRLPHKNDYLRVMNLQQGDVKKWLSKLDIDHLNEMQMATSKAISEQDEVILLSPTGTGKTIAFLLPILAQLDIDTVSSQVLILVPSRELAIQIEEVLRKMGTGYKVNAVYGGRPGYKDKVDLRHPPIVLVGTPGRVADHIRNQVIDTEHIHTLVLDEFDKSLETGFEKDMIEIFESLPAIKSKVLTSATDGVAIPSFLRISDPSRLDFLEDEKPRLSIRLVTDPALSKRATLGRLLSILQNQRGILFCNLRDSVQALSDHLRSQGINHGAFYGGLEQVDRERSLIQFRNGTFRLLVATDLAARGLDVPALDYIIHYELPRKEEEFIHRNGRTARMHAEGTAYIIHSDEDYMPPFVASAEKFDWVEPSSSPTTKWTTLYISGGRRDKISKGDIAGLFFKQGGAQQGEIGTIELKQDCAYVSVHQPKAAEFIRTLNNSKLKKKKVRISFLKTNRKKDR